MRIPEVRVELRKMVVRLAGLAAHYNDLELSEMSKTLLGLVIELNRRPAVKKAAPKARPITRALKAQIRAYAAANPGLSNREIGLYFLVDGGRVSEALAGKRT